MKPLLAKVARESSHRASRTAVAQAPATCGELFQGTLDGIDFLVTAPIDLYSTAEVTSVYGMTEVVSGASGVNHDKAIRAVRALLTRYGLEDCGARLQLDSPIPRGKGLASSSADITATIHAAAEAFGLSLAPHEMSKIAVTVEPTDAVFFQGVVAYNHLHGELVEVFGAPPPLRFIVVDTGGAVETVGLDRRLAREVSAKNEAQLRRGLDLIRAGFAEQDPKKIAAGATVSAKNHQAVMPKAPLDTLLEGTAEFGALGCNVGHSGTVIGVMFDPRTGAESTLLPRVEQLVGRDAILGIYSLVSGGSRLVRSSLLNITPQQEPFFTVFGDPVRRIPHEGQFVLEFAGKDRRFFAYPDGTLHLTGPDASEGLAVRPADAPRPGETWELKVEVLEATDQFVQYRPRMSGHRDSTAHRVLSSQAFWFAFERVDDAVAARRVRIISLDEHSVVYDREDQIPGRERTSMSLTVFLSNFARVK